MFIDEPLDEIRIKCREKVVRKFEIQIPGFLEEDDSESDYKYRRLTDTFPEEKPNNDWTIQILNQDARPRLSTNLQNWLKVYPLLSKCEGNMVTFKVEFFPMKPFRQPVFLYFKKPTTGAWVYQLNLVAVPPEIDDIIHIESPVRESRSV